MQNNFQKLRSLKNTRILEENNWRTFYICDVHGCLHYDMLCAHLCCFNSSALRGAVRCVGVMQLGESGVSAEYTSR